MTRNSKSTRVVTGALACFSAIAVCIGANDPERPPNPTRTSTTGTSHLRVAGSRSMQQRQNALNGKLDAALADLTGHVALVSPGHPVSDLRSLNPAARFKQHPTTGEPLILIDAVTLDDPQQLKNALIKLGLLGASVYSNDVSGWLPLAEVESASRRPEVHSIRAAMFRTHAVPVTDQGDFAQRSDVLRATYPSLTGSGVQVGILSDSYNCYATYAANNVPAGGVDGYANNGFIADAALDVSTGDLPIGVNVIQEADCLAYNPPGTPPINTPFTDEGRAMLQVVHHVAPGASLSFYTVENGEAAFANGIGQLAAAGANVIADDAVYFDEPISRTASSARLSMR
jgi:hypothetical protein